MLKGLLVSAYFTVRASHLQVLESGAYYYNMLCSIVIKYPGQDWVVDKMRVTLIYEHRNQLSLF